MFAEHTHRFGKTYRGPSLRLLPRISSDSRSTLLPAPKALCPASTRFHLLSLNFEKRRRKHRPTRLPRDGGNVLRQLKKGFHFLSAALRAAPSTMFQCS